MFYFKFTTCVTSGYIYFISQQVAKGKEASDYRLFVRCIIRHSDLVTKEASFEYLHNEGEKTLLEAMDSLEVAFSHPMVSCYKN